MIGTRLNGTMREGPIVYYFTQVWRARLRPWCDWSPCLRHRELQGVAGGYGMMGILVDRRELFRRPER